MTDAEFTLLSQRVDAIEARITAMALIREDQQYPMKCAVVAPHDHHIWKYGRWDWWCAGVAKSVEEDRKCGDKREHADHWWGANGHQYYCEGNYASDFVPHSPPKVELNQTIDEILDFGTEALTRMTSMAEGLRKIIKATQK